MKFARIQNSKTDPTFWQIYKSLLLESFRNMKDFHVIPQCQSSNVLFQQKRSDIMYVLYILCRDYSSCRWFHCPFLNKASQPEVVRSCVRWWKDATWENHQHNTWSHFNLSWRMAEPKKHQRTTTFSKLVLSNQAWCMTVLYIEFAFLGVPTRAKQMCSRLRLGKKLNRIELYERWQKKYNSNFLKNMDCDNSMQKPRPSVNKQRRNHVQIFNPCTCWRPEICRVIVVGRISDAVIIPPSCPNLGPAPFIQATIVGTNRGFSGFSLDGSCMKFRNHRKHKTSCWLCPAYVAHHWKFCHKMSQMLLWSWLDFSLHQCWAAGSFPRDQRTKPIVSNLASHHLAMTIQVGAVVHLVKGGQTLHSWLVSLAHVAKGMILRLRPTRPARQTAVAGTYRLSTLGQSFKVGGKGGW